MNRLARYCHIVLILRFPLNKCSRECRCEWVAYLESALYCFDEDEDYKYRVQQNILKWEQDYREKCLDLHNYLKGAETDGAATVIVPQFSLDPAHPFYCHNVASKPLDKTTIHLLLLAVLIWTLLNL